MQQLHREPGALRKLLAPVERESVEHVLGPCRTSEALLHEGPVKLPVLREAVGLARRQKIRDLKGPAIAGPLIEAGSGGDEGRSLPPQPPPVAWGAGKFPQSKKQVVST